MGGHVKLIIRKESGEIYSGVTHTNSLTYKFINRDFLTGKAIDDCIKSNIAWENQEKVPCSLMSPIDYGIVLFDFKTKTILDWQGYTSLNRSLLYNDMTQLTMIMSFLDKHEIDNEVINYIKSSVCDNSDIQNTLNLFENGSHIGYSQHNNLFPGQKIMTECTDFKKVMTFGLANERTRFKYEEGDTSIQSYTNNLFGFKYQAFSDVDNDSSEQMKLAITELGINICEQSLKAWREYDVRH